ncbi:MAG TPA: FlgD immunoglobulin-like domain containing protein, partial [Calditrichia bacterium]|nr:FlgD immunoglobulin-like domain containing protein [Calditrichia bacterium]HQV33158.1 FlgD immunoglobulin-like domain containing protein [Calditrichia bacterium]
NPTFGVVPAGGSVDVQVIADATGLAVGSYNGRLNISSNDPVNPEMAVAFTLIVDDQVGIDGPQTLPSTIAVAQNYPNPFNPTTTIAYELPRAGEVSLVIYNVLGQVVRTLVSGQHGAGRFQAIWDARNDLGERVGSGIYLYRFDSGDYHEIRKMILLK